MTAKATLKRNGMMASVLGRLTAGESLINDRHAQTMLMGLLYDADQIEDATAGWEVVRAEVAESWGFDEPGDNRKPFIYQDGVAVIPIHGVLINRFNHCWGYVTGYDFIQRQQALAEEDEDVKLIVHDHDTPGGEAAGCDEAARRIFTGRSKKPTLAIVNTLSASAGFWIASAASRIICAPSGSVGSIGVYIQHMNIKKLLAEWGVETEFIKNGKFKTSGNMFEELSAEDREYLQQMVDERAAEFHSAVAEFRGIEESVVKDTQARVMRPTEALSLGLIDAAIAPADAVSSFLAEMGNDEIIEDEAEEQTMADAPELTAEQKAAIAKETKDRIKGIVTSDEAKGRSALADHLAYNTDQTVEEAKATLAVSAQDPEPAPEGGEGGDDAGGEGGEGGDDAGGEGGEGGDDAGGEGDKAKGSAFKQAMDNGAHPEVGADGEGGGTDGDKTQASIDRIMGNHSKATGRKFDRK